MPWIELRKLAPHALDRTSQISATRPERAEAPSPGQRPGFFMPASLSPCKGKSFKTWCLVKLLPLQGALLIAIIPRALPWARSFCPFRACGAKLAKVQLRISSYNQGSICHVFIVAYRPFNIQHSTLNIQHSLLGPRLAQIFEDGGYLAGREILATLLVA